MHRGAWTALAAVVVAGLIGAGLVANQIDARQRLEARVRALTHGGDPAAGRLAIERRTCGGCHEVPGVPTAVGKVGPSLDGIASRVYIAGRLENTPDNMMRWITDPQSIEPGNAMPPTGVAGQEARNIAAYLYTLE
ncbi:MAG: c-type cytochrome [Phenylobacterium sp.]